MSNKNFEWENIEDRADARSQPLNKVATGLVLQYSMWSDQHLDWINSLWWLLMQYFFLDICFYKQNTLLCDGTYFNYWSWHFVYDWTTASFAWFVFVFHNFFMLIMLPFVYDQVCISTSCSCFNLSFKLAHCSPDYTVMPLVSQTTKLMILCLPKWLVPA